MATDTTKTLTIAEVAKRLRVSIPTIYRQMKKGTFAQPIQGIGRCLRWDAANLEDWITAGNRK